MTRPAIVIGLGGTGQWVLTFLKKELLEIGNGSIPPGVKLLSFDTTSQTTAAAGQSNQQRNEQRVSAGAVELTEGTEFIPIGDNILQLAGEISRNEHAHLQWFPASSYIGKLPTAAFNTKEGSGQIRQMGRISIFRDLSAPRNSKVLSFLRQALQDLNKQGNINRDRQLEVLVIGSLAGGTGAGMLVDIPLLIRAQAASLSIKNYIVRGFFVLPRAFVQAGLGEDQDMLARAFAAWRELDRFMIVSERFGQRQIKYHGGDQSLWITVDRRVYDVSYMVDPARQTATSLDNMKGEDGLFPALSHCISAILDDKAGQAYTEFVSTNLAGKLAQLPRRPYHSAIGSYTLKVPVYYAHAKFSHQLALEVLRELLAPRLNDRGRVTSLSEIHNKEVPEGYAGKRSVLSFMSASGLNIAGNDIPNTRFLPLVAEVREQDAQREARIINQWARGGLTRGQNKVLLAMTDISQDETGKVIQRDITDELTRMIWQDVLPSRIAGDTPDQAYARIRNKVEEVSHQHYGVETVEGGQLRGTYGKALDAAKRAQMARYHTLLQAWTLNTLNGQSEDPVIARGAKLGYTLAFYDELINTFTYFVGFLNMVRKARNEELKLVANAKQAANSASQFYNQERSKRCWLPFWDDFTHPDAHRAQRGYLMAEQRRIDVRKDDILLDVLAETAIEMRMFAEQTRDEISSWIAHLATGDPGLNVQSLYMAAKESLDNVNVNHELDKKLSAVSQLVGEHEYRSDAAFIAETLGRMRWRTEISIQGLRIFCGLEIPTDNPDVPTRYEPLQRNIEEPSRHNLGLLLRLAERRFQTVYQDRPLATEIMKVYPKGEELAKDVDKRAEPFYLTDSSQQGPQVVANYIRVHSTVNDQTTRYFQDFLRELQSRNPNILNLKMEDSEDRYKMTIVRSDDLLLSTDYEMWHACRRAYIRQITDPRRDIKASELHVFPAEINACYYEAEMPPLLSKDYRTLHPEVVALLEDRDRFEMFFRAVALGFIQQQVDDKVGASFWVYRLNETQDMLYITIPTAELAGTQQQDIFQVIHNFVMEGKDQRPGLGQTRRVNWNELKDTILSKQRELGKAKATRIYRQEIDGAKGIVQRIRADVEQRRKAIPDETLRQTIGQEHEDLADLAQVVLLKAINSLS